ncbi:MULTISPECIES: hypothetical protein [Listeria]|uniref:hypothetical protein n=1 Tax=Listeria TaxID=1637 RepID=UPI000B5961B3|nr:MULTISPECIES: hypothetical protein [Listeria]
MVEKTNEGKRTAYNQLIVEKENQIDQLSEERATIENALERLEVDLQNGFQRLQILNEENANYQHKEDFRMQQRNDCMAHSFRQQIRNAHEEFTFAFKKEICQMDEERETLYKERNELPWD